MVRFPKRSRKTDPFSALVKKLDRIFSEFIRLRDADAHGYCRCITCGSVFFWREGDAGHFVSRDRKATRWDERNVHAQCARCNRFRSGEQYEHGRAIDRLHGKGTADLLQNISRMVTKVSSGWLLYHIDKYKEKVKELKKKKMVGK